MRRRVSAAWLVWLAAALAVVSVGLAAAPLPGRFAGESGLPRPEPVAREDAAQARVSLDAILALSPFGRITPPAEPEPEAQETDLGLTLHGVVIAARPEASRAIVSGSSEPARSYGVGQAVAGGATLVEVQRDHVMLDVGGRRETLSFPEAGGGEPGGGDAEPSDNAEPSDDAEASGDGLDTLRALISNKPPARVRPAEPSGGDDDDFEAVVAGYRERLRDDPRRVLDDLGLVATEAGYEVGADPGSPVRRAGLEPGDLVAKVNGQQVGDIERDRKFFDEVVASGRARVEVVRNGQRIPLSFPLK